MYKYLLHFSLGRGLRIPKTAGMAGLARRLPRCEERLVYRGQAVEERLWDFFTEINLI